MSHPTQLALRQWLALPLLLVAVSGCQRDPGDPVPDDARDLAFAAPPDLGATIDTHADDLAVPPIGVDAGLPPYVPIDGGGQLGIVELVSPAVCRLQNQHLVDCDIGLADRAAPETTEAAPWSTIVTTRTEGSCSVRYPMELALRADDDPELFFEPFNPSRSITVRHPSRDRIGTLHVRDASAWRPYATYDASCRIWIEIVFNVHDPV